MKKSLLIFVIGIFSISAISQNLQNLDKKYGINIFKLGSPYTQYASNCNYEFTSKDGVKYYFYKKPLNVKIFNFFADSVLLGFYKDKLYTISIDLMLLISDDDVKSLLKNLEGLFGKGTMAPYDEMFDIGYFWKTSKTYLGFQKVSCSASFKPCSTNIYLISKSIDEQIKSDGF
jgi:hypothetical protein